MSAVHWDWCAPFGATQRMPPLFGMSGEHMVVSVCCLFGAYAPPEPES
jgi:hypothetical protein